MKNSKKMVKGIDKQALAIVMSYFIISGAIADHFFSNMSNLGYFLYALFSIGSGMLLYSQYNKRKIKK